MSTIAIAMLPELGHINATLKLARSLRLRCHDVYYLVSADYEAYLRAQDLNFISLGEVLDGPQSVAFRQAHHKLTGALSVLAWSISAD